MDNMLLQVRGRKRCVLFAPRDVDKLYMRGDKSSIIDIDAFRELKPSDPRAVEARRRFPLFAEATRYECTLQDGDILYIPGTASTVTSTVITLT